MILNPLLDVKEAKQTGNVRQIFRVLIGSIPVVREVYFRSYFNKHRATSRQCAFQRACRRNQTRLADVPCVRDEVRWGEVR